MARVPSYDEDGVLAQPVEVADPVIVALPGSGSPHIHEVPGSSRREGRRTESDCVLHRHEAMGWHPLHDVESDR